MTARGRIACWGLCVAAAAAVLLLAALSPFVFFDQQPYKNWLGKAVESRTGRAVEIGQLGLEWAWPPRLRATDIRVANAAWGIAPWALSAEKITVATNLSGLLFGEVRAPRVTVTRPKLYLERNAAGEFNVARPGRRPHTAPPTNRPPRWLLGAAVEITEGEVNIQTPRRRWHMQIQTARLVAPPNTNAPVALDITAAVAQVPVRVAARMDASAARSAVTVDANIGDGVIRATGYAAGGRAWSGLELDLQVAQMQLPTVGKLFGFTWPAIGPIDGRGKLQQPGNLDTLQLREIQLQSHSFGLRNTVRGAIPKLYPSWELDLHFSSHGVFKPPWEFWRGAGLTTNFDARLSGARRDLILQVRQARARNANWSLAAAGALNLRDGETARALPLTVAVKNFAPWWGDYAANPRGPRVDMNAAAHLGRANGVWHLRDMDIKLRQQGLHLTLGGEISRLSAQPNGKLTARARAADAAFLRVWRPRWPAQVTAPITDIQGAAEIILARGAIRVPTARLQADAYGAKWSLRGGLNDARRGRGADFAVRAAAENLTRLPFTDRPPPRGKFALQARLHDDAGGLYLTDLRASLINAPTANAPPALTAQARGQIRHLTAAPQADIALEVGLNSAAVLRRMFVDAAGDMPVWLQMFAGEIPLQATGKLHSADWARWGIREISLAAATGRLALSGDIATIAPLSANLALHMDDFAINRWPPLSGETRLQLGAGGRADMDLRIGRSDAAGQLRWRTDRDILRLTGKLDAELLDFTELHRGDKRPVRLFSNTPFNHAWLTNLDADLALNAKRLRLRPLNMTAAGARLTIKKGVLTQTLDAQVGAENLHLRATFDSHVRPPAATLKMHGRQLSAAELIWFANDANRHGSFDLAIEVAARGHSPAEMAGDAAGLLSLRLTQTKLKNQSLTLFGGDIFSNLLTALNPARSVDAYIRVECGFLRANIAAGKTTLTAEDLALKTERVTLFGGGDIDFGAETLNIAILPRARKGFGINPLSLTQLMRIGGTFREPKIEADASRLWRAGAAVSGALYSGGLSLILQGLLDRTRANADVCAPAPTAPPQPHRAPAGDDRPRR